jgi:hypothetical protein
MAHDAGITPVPDDGREVSVRGHLAVGHLLGDGVDALVELALVAR